MRPGSEFFVRSGRRGRVPRDRSTEVVQEQGGKDASIRFPSRWDFSRPGSRKGTLGSCQILVDQRLPGLLPRRGASCNYNVCECWHNNHHAFPESAKLGLEDGETDPGWAVLQWLRSVGLVWNLGLPRPESHQEDLTGATGQDQTPIRPR